MDSTFQMIHIRPYRSHNYKSRYLFCLVLVLIIWGGNTFGQTIDSTTILKEQIIKDSTTIDSLTLDSTRLDSTRLDSVGLDSMNTAYGKVFGQGLWIIIGSLVAFLFGQIVDVVVFHWIKERTGERKMWLRATGSTLVSQFFDSYIVLIIAFYFGSNWDFTYVMAIGTVNYVYKSFVAILLTPIIYLVHHIIDRYLGLSLSTQMKNESKNFDYLIC